SQCSSNRRRSMFPWFSSCTRLELLLLIMCLLLAIGVIALIIVVSRKSQGQADIEDSKASGAYTGHIPPNIKLQDICLSKGCVNAASRLLTSIDPSVHPCDDFFDFACGNWNKMNVVPEDKHSYTTFSMLGDEIQVILKNLLELPINPKEDLPVTIKAKTFYNSCLNDTQTDIIGLEPMKAFINDLGGWPVLRKEPRNQNYDVLSLLVKLFHQHTKIIIEQAVAPDDKNSEVNIIQLDQAELGMPSPDYFLSENSNKLQVYQAYALDVTKMLNATDPVLAERDIQEIIAFEVQLAKLYIPKSLRRDNEEMYNKMTIKEFSKMVPEFDWVRYFHESYKPVGFNITEDEHIIVYAPSYFRGFGQLYQRTDKRVIVNYILWRSIMNRVPYLPKEHRKINTEFSKSMTGISSTSPRWYECTEVINEHMGNTVGRLFIEKYFDEGSKETALEMIHDIRNAFYELLDEADWMDDKTRKVAKEKAEAISEKIGYADSIFNDTALNAEFAGVEFKPDQYFHNILTSIKHQAFTQIKKLRDPVDRARWTTTPAVVNAFYSSSRNQIMFPAAILQPPFYSKEYPKSLNYGGIGMVIGHEITHGFDDKGRQYDKNGILVQWWDDEVIRRFKERAQCIIDQYSNYTVPEVNMNVNGIQTQGENIADNGGIKEAYRAYKKYANAKGHSEGRLPGLLQYNSDQLFFINFAQVWCGIMRPETTINRIKIGFHSPGRFRVIGTLQNLPAFSEVFNCPVGSYMNRKDKCTVW
ncbi:neprilysin-1, partial [Biomphalaria glabrata]